MKTIGEISISKPGAAVSSLSAEKHALGGNCHWKLPIVAAALIEAIAVERDKLLA